MSDSPDKTPLTELSAALASLVAAASPSLVSVHSHRARSSGLIWKDGLIVTADEALAEEEDVAVTLAGGKEVSATIAGRDPTTDVALLRADTGNHPAAAFAGDAPPPGALAMALGNRHGTAIVAFGAVATSGPAWQSMRGGEIDRRIELDLSLRPASEGGLAIDGAGRAFGMTVFAPRRRVLVIPQATITRVAALLEARGRVPRGYLGLSLQSVRLDQGGRVGAMVMGVDHDGPGAGAGVQQGDIIETFDGKPIGSVHALSRKLGPSSVGRTVALSLRRGGETRAVDLLIAERPAA